MATRATPIGNTATRSIEARLSDADLRRLDERVLRSGLDRAECVGLLSGGGREAPPGPAEPAVLGATLDEIFAPVHREFAESGMTEDELYQLLDEAREEVWQEAQQSKGIR
jgi:hypothetical protein